MRGTDTVEDMVRSLREMRCDGYLDKEAAAAGHARQLDYRELSFLRRLLCTGTGHDRKGYGRAKPN
jgi:hypothetical protein